MERKSLSEAIQVAVPALATPDRQVLQALLYAPGHEASAGQLKTILGFRAVVQVNAAMGRIGRSVFKNLRSHPDGLESRDLFEWWHVVATGSRKYKSSGFFWRLRDEVVHGLLSMGFSESGDRSPNELTEKEVLCEGAARRVLVNAYERNPVARSRCVEAYGARCFICGFDFGVAYGPSAAGFIHVHHIKAIASIGAQYEVNPIKDLRPVCPNCHAVLHMSDPPRSIDEVKALLLAYARDQFKDSAS